jgi:DNA-binding winged helix-turn-helix (wHTH) protein/Tol biopolymer transport system component
MRSKPEQRVVNCRYILRYVGRRRFKPLTMNNNRKFVYEFGPFRMDPYNKVLLRDGQPIAVTPKAFETLLVLVRRSGEVVPKEELLKEIWPDSFVEEANLNQNIFMLRKALGDTLEERRYIVTIPARGYRFAAPVRTVFGEGETLIAQMRSRTEIAIVESAMASDTQNTGLGASGGKGTIPRSVFSAGIILVAFSLLGARFLIRRVVEKHGVVVNFRAYPLTERRITSNPPEAPLTGAVVSPDVKYVVYSDPTGLYLRQLSTGETRLWSLPKSFLVWPDCWFPDGAHLLVLRIDGQPGTEGIWKPSLYKLSLLGGEPQKIMDDAAAGVVSPDGTRIAYLPNPALSNELWVMDSDGANSRKVVSAATRYHQVSMPGKIYPLVWSPNGNRLAYVEHHFVAGPDPVGPTFSLQTIGRNGDSPTVVLDDPRIGPALWWTPDGRILFAYREDPAGKQNNYGVYSIRIDERTGKATGSPQPITQAEGGISGLSATADGKRLVVWRTNAPTEVFITKFDARNHQWKEPRRLTLDSNDNIADAWTLDSKAVLFVSNRNGTWRLFKQNIAETTPEVMAEGPGISLPRLSADGTQILYLSAPASADVSFPASLMSKPLAGGPPRQILQGRGIINFQCAQAPSPPCIFSRLDGQTLVFSSFDLEHGAGRELLRIPNGYTNWSLSSDGSKLAIFLDPHRIRFVTLATAAAHDVTVKDWPLSNGDWAANGHSVYMPSGTSKGIPVILEVDQAGRAKVVIEGSANIGFACMVQSPDGLNGLLLEFIPAENNAWIVDNF